MPDTQTIQGSVPIVTFQNEETGFSIIKIQRNDLFEQCTCVGVMPTVQVGETLVVRGTWEKHKKYGDQFAVVGYEHVRPTTVDGIFALLRSGFVANIGTIRAQKMIDTFGEKTLDILDNAPERLIEVPGIGRKTLPKIANAWKEQKHMRDLMLYLQSFDISLNLSYKIYKAYGTLAKEKVSTNPYGLVEDVWGVGFKKADAIAQKLGFTHDSYRRIRAGITFVLQEATFDGHCYLPQNELLEKAEEILGVKGDAVLFSLDHLASEKLVIREEDRIFLPMFFNAEKKVGEQIAQRILSAQKAPARYSKETVTTWLTAYMLRTAWEADPKQMDALVKVVAANILLLTGGPGTGKTTTLQMIVSFFREHHLQVLLAAPTGRAAQRMGSVAGLSAKTIHRLLEFRPNGGEYAFSRNADNPLEADAVIIDEVSMIDIQLMRSLLAAIKTGTIVVFVGDNNQLPSVGPGNVLADLIACGAIAHVHLTTIFRQAAKSRIVCAAHEILNGSVPFFANEKSDNCFFISQTGPDDCLSTIVELITSRLPKTYGLNPMTDIQVLTPMHKGTLGTHNINRALQTALNTHTEAVNRGEIIFKMGDKVMQIRNNYDKNIFNGDIGIITSAHVDDGLTVIFDEREVTYGLRDLDELVPAYCISIHKSQGCEFRAIVVPVMTQHYIMLQRNLLYTALTRARELCVFVGMPQALAIAVNNNEVVHRYSRLTERVMQAMGAQ